MKKLLTVIFACLLFSIQAQTPIKSTLEEDLIESLTIYNFSYKNFADTVHLIGVRNQQIVLNHKNSTYNIINELNIKMLLLQYKRFNIVSAKSKDGLEGFIVNLFYDENGIENSCKAFFVKDVNDRIYLVLFQKIE